MINKTGVPQGNSIYLPTLQLEASQVPQVPQAANGIFYILRRVEGFLWQTLKHPNDLVIGTMLLGKLNEIFCADRVGNLVKYLVYLSKINAHMVTSLFLVGMVRST